MKKTMIIALLAVLVMGAFTACNGEVNAELAGGTRIITLEISNNNWYFTETGTKTMELEIPSDCKTWADLEAKGSTINVTQQGNDPYELRLSHDFEFARYFYTDGTYYISARLYPMIKGDPAQILISSDIDSENYRVYIDIWQ